MLRNGDKRRSRANATLVDDVGQLTVLSAGRSGELVELQQVSPPRYTQVLANTEVQMRATRNSGQHVVEGVVHRGLLFRVERATKIHRPAVWEGRSREAPPIPISRVIQRMSANVDDARLDRRLG